MALGANAEKVLKNIFVARAFNSDHQMLLLEKVNEMVKGWRTNKTFDC